MKSKTLSDLSSPASDLAHRKFVQQVGPKYAAQMHFPTVYF